MPKILVDLERLKHPYCGLGQFSKSLGKALLRNAPRDYEFTFLAPRTAADMFGSAVKLKYAQPYKKNFFPFIGALFFGNFDLWHTTHQDSDYFPYHQKSNIVLTIHDLNFLSQKSIAKQKKRIIRLQQKIDLASRITTISEYTKKEILGHFNMPNQNIPVIHNGIELESTAENIKPNTPEGHFLFTIGEITSKKNFHVLVEMMSFLPNLNLVIAGKEKGSYASRLKQRIDELGLHGRVRILGPISNQERLWLYKNCRAFVFPSIAEGFGIPPLEAMSMGKPVFLSKLSSLPEIGGNHAYYWDNFEPKHMASVVNSGIEDYSLNIREKLPSLINHSLNFNWDNAAKQYLQVYDEVLAKRSACVTRE